MPKISIVTDTDSSIPAEMASHYGIRQVPINIHFDAKTYAAVEELSDQQLYQIVDNTGKLPTTSAPSPGTFAEIYESAFNEGAEEVICFTVSSKISAVYNAAMSAKELLPDRVIRVIDTESLSMGQGFMVLAAAQAARDGSSSDEVISYALETGKKVHLFAALSTLKYLAMSGRVGHLTAGIANLLDVRPILTLKNGKLDLLERARTQKKAWNRVIDLSQEALGDKKIVKLAVLHVNAVELADQFRSEFCEVFPCPDEIMTVELTPGLSVHTGSGVVGITFLS